MALPTLRRLLPELDRTTHSGRVSKVVRLALDHRDDPALPALLDGLTDVSAYHAGIVLTVAKAIGDTGRLRALSAHPFPAVSFRARASLPLEDRDAAAFLARYLAEPLASRHILVRQARLAGRTDLIAALVDAPPASAPDSPSADAPPAHAPLSDTCRAALLASADEATVAAHIADIGDLVPRLRALGRRHPGVLFDELARRLDGAPPALRQDVWAWVTPALVVLAEADPGRLLDLLEEAGPPEVLPTALDRRLGLLGRHAPGRLAALFIRRLPTQTVRPGVPPWRLARGMRACLAKLDDDALAQVAHACEARLGRIRDVLAALPPSRRDVAFRAAFEGVDVAKQIWGRSLIDVLSRETRERVAPQMDAPPVAYPGPSDMHKVLTYLGFLAPDEAWKWAEPQLRANDASERQFAYSYIIAAAWRSCDDAEVARAFALLDRLTNEQDQVRNAVAQELARVPIEMLARAPREPLERFATSAVQARDSSGATLQALRDVAWALLVQAAVQGQPLTWEIGLLDLLSGPNGFIVVPPAPALRRGAEHAIIEALRPRMEAAAKRGAYDTAFSLCRTLGRRAWGSEVLNALLLDALTSPSDQAQRTAADFYLGDPRHRADRVAWLLDADESFATLPAVQEALCSVRQDLVGSCFGPEPLQGRFWRGRVRFVAVLPGPFTGWLPGQLAEYAEALHALVADTDTPDRTRMSAIATLGRLPMVGADALRRYLDGPDVVCQEAALGALSRIDRPGDALPLLLAHRSDDRARVALYAAGRSARYVAPADASRQFEEVLADPASRITARREAVRLLGRLRSPGAVDAVVAAALDGHRGVRMAAGRTMCDFLDDERSWTALEGLARLASPPGQTLEGERSAQGEPSGHDDKIRQDELSLLRWQGRQVALSLAKIRPGLVSVRHRSRLAGVLWNAASGGEDALISRLRLWVPWAPELLGSLAGLAREGKGHPVLVALDALGGAVKRVADWTVLQRLAVDLAAAAVADAEPDAEESEDLPHRQRLGRLISLLWPHSADDVVWFRAQRRDLGAALAAYPDAAAWSWGLRLTAVDWADPARELVAVAGAVPDDRVAELRQLATSALEYARDSNFTLSLDEAVEDLLGRPGAARGALAFVLVASEGKARGWPKAWRERLRRLRRHPSGAVVAWARGEYSHFF